MHVKTSHRRCVECDCLIPVERLRLLPDTWTCVRHSGVTPLTEDTLLLDGTDPGEQLRTVVNAEWTR